MGSARSLCIAIQPIVGKKSELDVPDGKLGAGLHVFGGDIRYSMRVKSSPTSREAYQQPSALGAK